MKKYFATDYEKYTKIMKKHYPQSTLNYEKNEIENVIITTFKIKEIIKKVEDKHIKHIKENTYELMYTLDNFLITLPIFRKKVVYLLLRNVVESIVNSWVLSIHDKKFSSFRENKEAIKNTAIYNGSKNLFDNLFNYYAEFSRIIHFSGAYVDDDFLNNRIKLECSDGDWKKINRSLIIILKSLLNLLREDENKFSTQYKVLLQDILSKNEYDIIVNTKID
ncbi:hypothetical protein [Staphylococcus pseudintermedius]|nr:hypothetical protein [Staphylococcus pseudintermedius]EGQ3207495.1 hypothetical protein [Staphylococcus pseudintermedius]EGQ3320763.1 hypothetical protein [Staphylococcus pseudintermedius]EGQ4151583.1 hypothetical protein [Staphylococcus pseudintermedius]EHS7166209.1 hypothetical protein [Staphylococcus pseudintermedius]EHT3141262.1 hypothetical protein [Staphylococcus pseudintermedius]